MDAGEEGPPLETHLLVQLPHVRRWLAPFILTCSVYFLLWIPEDQPSWVSALVKSLPVLCLVIFLGAVTSSSSYARLLQGALVCSAVGDACLIWPEAFLYGMAAFALGHLLYIRAFGLTPLQPALLLLVLPALLGYFSLLLPHLEPDMAPAVASYGLILSIMLWRGLARGRSARWGALLFTISDSVLALDTFALTVPHARLVTMATYYAAQLLITLSALRSPEIKAN